MEIIKQPTPHGMELLVKGRLDAYWAEHLSLSLAEVIREGTHHITLNLGEVVYLSSAGIRVLIKVHKQLKGIDGALNVTAPSEQVSVGHDRVSRFDSDLPHRSRPVHSSIFNNPPDET